MQVFLGLGSNLGDRRALLARAIGHIERLSQSPIRVSPVYQTPAMLPKARQSDWSRPFLNTVVEIQYPGEARQLLSEIQKIENELGRVRHFRWQPREIDIDILKYGDQHIQSEELTIPHAEMNQRNFVLEPLKDLDASYLADCRRLPQRLPQWMNITNLTPDSFSDGGHFSSTEYFQKRLEELEQACVPIIDLGAESTRPNASIVSPEEEWSRLEPFIDVFKHHYAEQRLRPQLSIDSRHPAVIEKCIESGIEIINDVSGDIEGFSHLISNSNCSYVLMHSLSVPADPQLTCPQDQDIVEQLKSWLEQKLNFAADNNIDCSKLIFDPGVGFGKTADQSLDIINRVEEFFDLPIRILVGHSRKSFMKSFAPAEAKLRDPESMGISMQLAKKGVDIIRVHNADLHARCFLGFSQS